MALLQLFVIPDAKMQADIMVGVKLVWITSQHGLCLVIQMNQTTKAVFFMFKVFVTLEITIQQHFLVSIQRRQGLVGKPFFSEAMEGTHIQIGFQKRLQGSEELGPIRGTKGAFAISQAFFLQKHKRRLVLPTECNRRENLKQLVAQPAHQMTSDRHVVKKRYENVFRLFFIYLYQWMTNIRFVLWCL